MGQQSSTEAATNETVLVSTQEQEAVFEHPFGEPGGAWEPPAPDLLQPHFAAYLIDSLLGRGGMGAVYRGTQISLDRTVAIKILPAALRKGDPDYARRFMSEAKVMAQMNHPGIVGVHDFGELIDGTLFLVLEYIEGEDVSVMLSRAGCLSPKDALAVTAHVCDALQYAHGRGIVHRDIKPANIIVSRDGAVKVADFGLAKRLEHGASSLSQSSVIMGTPAFIAPEAISSGNAVDHRADIFGVGVTLYQMLTGELPQGFFDPPSSLVKGLDARYDSLVFKAMKSNRDERFQQFSEMRSAVDGILTRPVVAVEALPTRNLPPRPLPSPQREVVIEKQSGGDPVLIICVLVAAVLLGWLTLQVMRPDDLSVAWMPPITESPVAKSGPSLPKDQLVLTAPTPKPPPAPPAPEAITKRAGNITLVDLGEKLEIPPGSTSRTTNLLARVLVSRDCGPGLWQKDEKGIAVGPVDSRSFGDASMTFPEAITALDYDIEIEFSLLEDTFDSNLRVKFPAAGKTLSWNIQLFKQAPTPYYGFPELDGVPALTARDACVRLAYWLQSGVRHKTRLQVRRDKLSGLVNGKTLVTWHGDLNRFHNALSVPLRHPRYPAVMVNGGSTIYHSAILYEYFAPTSVPADTNKLTEADQGVVRPAIVRSAAAHSTETQGRRVVNMLSLCDPVVDSHAGVWKRRPDGLMLASGTERCFILPPYEPPDEYDFRIEFTIKADRVGNVQLYAVHQGKSVEWVMQSLIGTSATYGYYGLKVDAGLMERGPAVVTAPLFVPNKIYESVLEVRRAGVRARLNGKLVTQWSRPFATNPPPSSSHQLGFGAWDAGVLFHRVEVIELSPSRRSTMQNSQDLTWVDVSGRSIEAGFVKIKGADVHLFTTGGQPAVVPLKVLSEKSKQTAQELQIALDGLTSPDATLRSNPRRSG